MKALNEEYVVISLLFWEDIIVHIILCPHYSIYRVYRLYDNAIDAWITSHLFTKQLEGITSPCCLLFGQYPHHMTLLPSSFYFERCYGIVYTTSGHSLTQPSIQQDTKHSSVICGHPHWVG